MIAHLVVLFTRRVKCISRSDNKVSWLTLEALQQIRTRCYCMIRAILLIKNKSKISILSKTWSSTILNFSSFFLSCSFCVCQKLNNSYNERKTLVKSKKLFLSNMDLKGPLLLCLDSVVCAKQKSIIDSSRIGHQSIKSELSTIES